MPRRTDLVELKSGLTLPRLKEVLHYNQETGIFTWLVRIGKASAGDVAGCPNDRGYIRIGIDGFRYRAHRLAWFYVHGEWPYDQIDHKNTNRAFNAFDNLRDADNSNNQANSSKLQRNNKSGFKGVFWHNRSQKWKATIWVNYKQIHLGFYDDVTIAAAAYAEASATYFGRFARVPSFDGNGTKP